MKIFMCDDRVEHLNYYSKLLKSISQKYDITVQIIKFNNGENLLFELEEQAEQIDAVFLDINMPEIDGINLAKKLNDLELETEIIFLTVSQKHFLNAFDVGAFNYIIKDNTTKERFEEIFLKVHQKILMKEQEYILFTAAGTYRNIPVKSILYFEVQKRIITVYYEDKSFEFFSTMGKLENQLFGKGFIRCHRSFLVSIAQIESLSYNDLTLSDGTVIPVGRTYYKNLKAALEQQESW